MSKQTNICERSYVVPKYVLVTAAYNEEAFIERVITSVTSQILLPEKWIIVSDCSTDRTEEIVSSYAERYPFIQLFRITEKHPRNFAAQVAAINAGVAGLAGCDYEFIGNLDADITLEPEYFAQLMKKFEGDPGLGLSGGAIYEESDGVFKYRATNNLESVAHGVQMFRRKCFELLGGYKPLPYGGPDWHAEVVTRMNGWRVQSHAELKAFHHRPTGTAGGLLRYCYRQGIMDFSLGCHPFFEIAKCISRLGRQPYGIGALARLWGFFWASCKGEERSVSAEFIAFLREEQKSRLRLSNTLLKLR